MPKEVSTKAKRYPILLAILLTSNLCAFGQWDWVNPLPQGNIIHDVKFIGANSAIAVGDCGTILKTTDGGNTWNRMESGTQEGLNRVFFMDSSTGYAISNGSSGLYKTTDGGSTWSLDHLFETFSMYDVWFTSPMHGVAVGEEAVFVTDDGGVTWLWKPPYTWNYSVWYTGPSAAVMASDGYMYKSYNGGNSWNIKHIGVNAWLGSLFFLDATTGLHVGRSGEILRTADAGETWNNIGSGTLHNLSAAYISPSGTGFIVGDSGTMLKTTDAGISWAPLPSITGYNLKTIAFEDAHHGIIMGDGGVLLMTIDDGNTWMMLSSCVTRKALNAVCFSGPNTGFIAGDSATLLKSSDGGNSWQPLALAANTDLTSVCFTAPQTGYVAGTHGLAFKSVDGGTSWNPLPTGVTDDLHGLSFPDINTGYAVAKKSSWDTTYLIKTADAGASWTNRQVAGYFVQAVTFTSADTGFAACNDGKILKTTDGGNSWSLQCTVPGIYAFLSISFPTKNCGFACGYGVICKTTDAGQHWDILYYGPLLFTHILFTDPMNGYALGFEPLAILFKTTDGGVTWSEKAMDQTCYPLNDLAFRDAQSGIMVGNNGLILKTGNSGGIISGLNTTGTGTDKEIRLYPNPCNGHFRVQLPGMENSVKIQVCSMIGGELFSGDYARSRQITIALPSIPAGACLVKITTGSSVVVKKLVISR
ncbi:MAG: YCF48-related protein [Bacteroidota bacterium]